MRLRKRTNAHLLDESEEEDPSHLVYPSCQCTVAPLPQQAVRSSVNQSKGEGEKI
jgi:hypothetical protein